MVFRHGLQPVVGKIGENEMRMLGCMCGIKRKHYAKTSTFEDQSECRGEKININDRKTIEVAWLCL